MEFVELLAAFCDRDLFLGTSQKITAVDRGCLPRFARRGTKRISSGTEPHAGRNKITIQVQDHEKIWRTIFVTDVWAFPLTFIGWMGLPRVEDFFAAYLTQFFLRNRRNIARSVMSHSVLQSESSVHRTGLQPLTGDPGSTQREIKTVHLFVTSKSNLFIREIAELLCAGSRATNL